MERGWKSMRKAKKKAATGEERCKKKKKMREIRETGRRQETQPTVQMQQGTMHDEIRKERGGGGRTIKERRQKEKINESKGRPGKELREGGLRWDGKEDEKMRGGKSGAFVVFAVHESSSDPIMTEAALPLSPTANLRLHAFNTHHAHTRTHTHTRMQTHVLRVLFLWGHSLFFFFSS